METVTIRQIESPPYRFMINATTHLTKEKQEEFFAACLNKDLNVEFKVNGVELPYSKTIHEIWRLMQLNIDRMAAEKVLEKVNLLEARLKKRLI